MAELFECKIEDLKISRYRNQRTKSTVQSALCYIVTWSKRITMLMIIWREKYSWYKFTFRAIHKLVHVHIYHVKILCEMYANALFTLKFMWGTINYAMCKCLKQVVHVIFTIQHGLVFYTKFPLQVQYFFNRACVYSHKSIYSHQSDGITREHWLDWLLVISI